MEPKIILSADSTCDLGSDLKERYQLHYYPCHIILDGKDYRDNADISAEEISLAYREKKILPKTAAINTLEYVEYFKGWAEEGCEVIHINLGGALSSSYQNCCLAAKELGARVPCKFLQSVNRNRASGSGSGGMY